MEILPQSEEWRPINGWEGYYVSNSGNIKRQSKEYAHKFFEVKGSISNHGYRYIQRTREGKRQNYFIHRCVAEAFIPNPENKPCVDHIDNNKTNNYVNNLRWCTQGDNCKNQKQKISGKKNGVRFDEARQKWEASIRVNNQNKFLGYFLTYDEAKAARETAEGGNDFYKRGDDEYFSDLKGRENIRKQKGSGCVQQRQNGTWRATLIQNGVKLFDKTFKTFQEAEAFRVEELGKNLH